MSAGVQRSEADAGRNLSGEDKCGGVVEIGFNVANSEGVNIYSRRDGDTDFKFLARDTVPAFITYTDSETWAGNVHPAQALRQYRD